LVIRIFVTLPPAEAPDTHFSSKPIESGVDTPPQGGATKPIYRQQQGEPDQATATHPFALSVAA